MSPIGLPAIAASGGVIPRFAEKFDGDLSAYTFDSGEGTLAVSGGVLTATATGDKRIYRTGLSLADLKASVKLNAGNQVAPNPDVGIIVRRLDATNYLLANLFVSGGAWRMDMYRADDGVYTGLAGAGGYGYVANKPVWSVVRAIGNRLIQELWQDDPRWHFGEYAPAYQPEGGRLGTVTYTLSGANATKFGEGVSGGVGLRFDATNIGVGTWDNFVVVEYPTAYTDPLNGDF